MQYKKSRMMLQKLKRSTVTCLKSEKMKIPELFKVNIYFQKKKDFMKKKKEM